MNPTFLSKYTLIDKIGEGSFSEVLKCEDKRTGKSYAAKRLKKVFKSTYEVANCAEIIAMNKLAKHPNIVYMVEFHYDPASGRVIFVFELMDMSMYDFMKLKKRRIPEIKVRHYLYQILKGLDHLHSHGLFHRDIKPENILIKLPNPRADISPPYQYQGELVKLADLGSIRGIYSKPPYTEYISTRWYRSPECLLTVGYYGPKMDIWATGCVFYEMLTLKPLFPGHDEIDQLARIHDVLGSPNERILRKLKKKSRNFSYFPKQIGVGFKPLIDKISEDAIAVLQLMIQYDPDLRTNVRRLLDHRFFRTLREDDLIQKFKYHIKDHSSDVINKSKGDFHTVYQLSLIEKKNKYKSSSSKSSSDKSDKKKSGFSLASKTTVDFVDYKLHVPFNHNLRPDAVPLVSQKQMKSWGVNPNILKSKDENKKKHDHEYKRVPSKIKQLSQRRTKPTFTDTQGFSKTTSNLPQISHYNNSSSTKAMHFQSKSFILPSRHTTRQFKVNNNELALHKESPQNTNKKNPK